MLQLPLVSIIIPIYGVEKYISRCAHSLFRQSYKNIEYIFVNDCTKDQSISVLSEIMRHYPDRDSSCRILSHEVNKGLSGARYTGLINSTGDYIMHVDSDDYLEDNAVEELVKAAVENDADIVIGGSYSVFPDNRIINLLPEHYDKQSLLYNILHLKVAPSIWGKLYSSKLYAPDKDTSPLVGVNHGEDFATVPRLLYYADRLAYVDKPLYNYVQFNSHSYTNNFSLRSMNDMIKATGKLTDFFNDKLSPEVLDVCALRVKAGMIKRMNIDLFDSLRTLYKDESARAFHRLAMTDKILLWLVDKGLYNIAKLYIGLGRTLKRI